MLETLGLDRDSEAVYLAILASPPLGVAGLADELGLTEGAVRAALDRLADLMLLRPSREVAGLLLPVKPQVALQALVRRQEQDLDRRRDEVAAARSAVSRLIGENGNVGIVADQPGSWCFLGLDAIQGRMEEITHQAQAECLSIVPVGAVPPEALEASRKLDRELLAKKVSQKTLYPHSIRNDPATTSYAQWLAGLGAEVRTTPALPTRMLIVDRSAALVPLNPAEPREGAAEITIPGVIALLLALFHRIWAEAIPFGDVPLRHPATGLSDMERQLLRLLAEGQTDDSAGRQLGLSVRTIRRIMADLMERLGAGSRFEAGYKAGANGWL